MIALTVAAAAAFAVAARRVTLGPEVTPHLFLSLGLTKHDNISTLEFKHIAGETLRTPDLGLILEGMLENATLETQFARYSVKNLPVGEANKQLVEATQYTYEWGRFVYVWADEAYATAPHRFHVRIEGNGENIRFASMNRVSLLHEPSRGVIFSTPHLPPVRLVLPPPPPPAYPAYLFDNIYIENTLITTNPQSPGHVLLLGSEVGWIYFGIGESNAAFEAHSWIDDENNWCLATSSGNVGIGTTSPAEKLEVAGSLKLSGGGRKLYGGADARLNIYHNTDAFDSRSWIELWGYHPYRAGELSLAGSYIDFRSNSSGDGTGTLNMRLDQNGNLGIWTPSPSHNLHVEGGNAYFGGNAYSGGNVGIGTTSPAANLHIYSTQNGWRGINIYIQGESTGQQGGINFITLGDGTKGIGDAATRGWHLTARGNSFTDAQNDLLLAFWDGSNWLQRMYIQEDTGNVGIGTTSPGAKLEVNGTGRFSGNVGVQGIIPYDVTGYDSGKFSGLFPGVVYWDNGGGNAPSWVNPPPGLPVYLMQPWVWHEDLDDSYTGPPFHEWLDQIWEDHDGAFRFWWFIGKPPAPYLYHWIGYVDDDSDVHLKDVTANSTTSWHEDGPKSINTTTKTSVDMNHNYILMAQYYDKGGDGDFSFTFWFGTS